jgi:hypothetical protein
MFKRTVTNLTGQFTSCRWRMEMVKAQWQMKKEAQAEIVMELSKFGSHVFLSTTI